MTTTTPRVKTGGKMHRIGTEAYFVIETPKGKEVTDRHPGHVWAAFAPDAMAAGFGVDLLFVDQLGDGAVSYFTITRQPTVAVQGSLFVDGERIQIMPIRAGILSIGDEVKVDWSDAFERMA